MKRRTTLKEQSNEIFDPHFFHHLNLPGPLTNRGIIPRGVSFFEPKTKIENVLTCWSVPQTGLNNEKTGGRKSRWTVPLMFVLIISGAIFPFKNI